MHSSLPQSSPIERSQTGRLRRWTKRVGIGLVGILFTLMAAGALYQASGQWMDARDYRATGRRVDVGGYSLHMQVSGNGAIPVVLEAGAGGGVLDWYKVQPELAKFTQVVSYDRAGLGWSDASPGPRSSAQAVLELHTLLSRAGIPAPYVLVGHSLGGLNMQLYAMRYPQEVAGLVLVDSSHADMATREEFAVGPFAWPQLVRVVAALGVVRFLNQMNEWDSLRRPDELGPGFKADIEHASAMLYSHTDHLVTMAQELAALPTSADQVRAAALQLDDKPLFVLTQGGQSNPSAQRAIVEATWKQWQADLVSRSRNAKQVVAERAGHYVHQDRPDVVVSAITRTVQAARDGTSLP